MSSWPLSYDYQNPHPAESPSAYRQTSTEELWNLLIIHIETFITYHIYLTTTHHLLSLSFHILNGTLRNRGDLSFRDAATLKWVHNQGLTYGDNWADAIPDWKEILYQEQRCYEMVNSPNIHFPIAHTQFNQLVYRHP
jgi:hypothetical protein